MIRFDNDKFSFSDLRMEDRDAAINTVTHYVGAEAASDIFLSAVRRRSDELGIDIETIDWDDNNLDPSDAVYDNAGETVLDALYELSALTCTQEGISWDEAVEDVLSQIG